MLVTLIGFLPTPPPTFVCYIFFPSKFAVQHYSLDLLLQWDETEVYRHRLVTLRRIAASTASDERPKLL